MKHKKNMGKIGILVGISLLAGGVTGCEKTPEAPVVRPKGAEAIGNYKEAESGEVNENGIGILGIDDVRAENSDSRIDLHTVLAAPKTYQSEISDTTGKLKVYTDAVVEIPEATKVSAIYVNSHPFEQAEMELITKAFFDDAQVYDASVCTEKTKEEWRAEIEKLKGYAAAGNLDPENWGTDDKGEFVYDLYGEIEKAEAAYQTAPEKREMKKVEPPFPFREELIDPFFAELGSLNSFYGIVPMKDGSYYRYEMVKSNSMPMQVSIKKVSDLSDIEESRRGGWNDYVSMKTLYSWLPDKEKLVSDIGISMEDAKKVSDEKVSKLNIEGMEVTASEYAVEIGGHNGAPRPEDLKNVGYCFHYTRKLNGIPITYTTETGGFKDDANSEIKPWRYETLDVYVTKEGIDAVSFINQYDIGDTKVNNLELMPFSEIMPIYEKMMVIQNADVLTDKRTSGEDMGAPVKERTYRINRITFGYSRIYDPQAGDSAGLLVPVWDFFGEYESDYGEGGKLVREEHNSFLTINAVDGTVISRRSGY
ncbi:MAG: hypothetical protein E7244_06070 [Enterocloster citroniae]|nr:hypothetical protein [Enterocloster citroniae]